LTMTTPHDLPPLPLAYIVDILPDEHRNNVFTAEMMQLYALAAIAPYKAEIEMANARSVTWERYATAKSEENAKLRELLRLVLVAHDHTPLWLRERIDAALGEKP